MKIRLVYLILLLHFQLFAIAQLDTTLIRTIQKMVDRDQTARLKTDSTTAKYGYKSTKMKDLWSYIMAIDNSHNSELKRIVKKAGGYPGYNILGEKGSNNFWLLVQHQDHDTAFQKEVLLLMKMQVDKQQASGKYYAYLLDRVNLNTGGKQVYGTQFWSNNGKRTYEPRPLEDPKNVNKRRAEVGLGPIEEMIEYFNKKSTELYSQYDTVLAHTIKQLIDEDQFARKRIGAIAIKYGKNSKEEKEAWNYLNQVDKKHNSLVKNIIKKTKVYPGISIVGEEGSNNFWALVQHQDEDTIFQKQVLKLMYNAVLKNDASIRDYDYLYDRLLINIGKKQWFGTQCELNTDETSYIPKPLADSLNVNNRRIPDGLGTIENYLEVMNEKYKHTLNEK